MQQFAHERDENVWPVRVGSEILFYQFGLLLGNNGGSFQRLTLDVNLGNTWWPRSTDYLIMFCHVSNLFIASKPTIGSVLNELTNQAVFTVHTHLSIL